MKVDDVVNIVIFYDKNWVRKDDKFWEFQNYHSITMSINKICTSEELENITYHLLHIDHNEHYLKMIFLYIACLQPFHPKDVEGDEDIKCFLKGIRDKIPKIPLCIQMFPRVP